MLDEILSEEKVCYNCKYVCWAIGVGRGLICLHPKKEIKFEPIQNRRNSCELFKVNVKIK
jgi:hypothetical protein